MDPKIAAIKGEMALEVARLSGLYPLEQHHRLATDEHSVIRKRYHRVCTFRNEVNRRIQGLFDKFSLPYHPDQERNEWMYAAALPFGTTLPDADASHAGTLWVVPFLHVQTAPGGDMSQITKTGLKYYIVPLIPDWKDDSRYITQVHTYHQKRVPGRLFALEETPDEAKLPTKFPERPDTNWQLVDAFLDEHELYLHGMAAALHALENYEPYL